MASSIERRIQYIFQLSTNIKEATDSAAGALDRTQAKVDGLRSTGKELSGTLSTVVTEAQRVDSAAQSAKASVMDMSAEAVKASADASNVGDRSDAAKNSTINLRRELQQTGIQASQYAKSLDKVRSATEEAISDVDNSLVAVDRKQVDAITKMTTILSMREGVSAVTSGLIGMGIATGSVAEGLNKLNAAFSLMSGVVSIVKSVQAVMTALNASTAAYAAITTYLKALKNPLAIGGILAVTGIVGATYLALSGGSGGSGAADAGGSGAAEQVTNNYSSHYTITGTGAESIAKDIGALTGGALR